MFLLLLQVSYAIEAFECGLNVQTLCAPGFKIRNKFHDTFAHWNFDYSQFVDVGPHNHITNKHNVKRTNSIFGYGATFSKDAKLEASFVPSFYTASWALSFVIMFEELGRQIKNTGAFINLYDDYDDPQKIFKVIINSADKYLIVQENDSELVKSRMRFQPSLWYRVFIIRHEYKLKLFVNGFLEATGEYKVSPDFKKMTIQIENDIPPFNIDAVKLFDREVQDWEVTAASQLFQQTSEWVQFNCHDCDIKTARTCPYGYHICNVMELYSFAIPAAKNMGWIDDRANFWAQETRTKNLTITEGAGLCCLDIDYIQSS